MLSMLRRWTRPGPGSILRRPGSKETLRVEPLEGRALLSYLVIPRGPTFVPVHVSDARRDEPLFGNGLAVKKAPHFYPFYTGPQRPELNGIQASGYVSGKNLVLTGTVAAPVVTKPESAALGEIYSFGIDRGGSGKTGPFPDRSLIRFDAVVNVTITNKKVSATVAATDRLTNQPGVKPTSLPSSAVSIKGAEVKVTVPLSMLPSSGHAIDQWDVNFFTRNPPLSNSFHSVASFTPEHTEFQIYVKRP